MEELRSRVRIARVRASLSLNRNLLELYWSLGRAITLRQEAEGWGSSVIQRVSDDLKRSFPGMQGFSVSNIWRMRAFVLAYRSGEEDLAPPVRDLEAPKLPAEVPDLPWSHQLVLIEKIPGGEELKDPYHLEFLLRCFVAVELKVGPFQPEHAEKMNFYLSALDERLRRDHDEPSIGLILCKERDRVVGERVRARFLKAGSSIPLRERPA